MGTRGRSCDGCVYMCGGWLYRIYMTVRYKAVGLVVSSGAVEWWSGGVAESWRLRVVEMFEGSHIVLTTSRDDRIETCDGYVIQTGDRM